MDSTSAETEAGIMLSQKIKPKTCFSFEAGPLLSGQAQKFNAAPRLRHVFGALQKTLVLLQNPAPT